MVVGREEAAAAAPVRKNHQARTFGQCHEARRFGIEVHVLRREPRHERVQRVRYHALQPREIEVRERDAVAPAAVTAAVACEREVLGADHRGTIR
jgi:hypothetical protein